MVSIMASIVISKFLYYIILVTISGKSFFQQNFNLTPKALWWTKMAFVVLGRFM
jgi:integral membrane sensor domain MASE1